MRATEITTHTFFCPICFIISLIFEKYNATSSSDTYLLRLSVYSRLSFELIFIFEKFIFSRISWIFINLKQDSLRRFRCLKFNRPQRQRDTQKRSGALLARVLRSHWSVHIESSACIHTNHNFQAIDRKCLDELPCGLQLRSMTSSHVVAVTSVGTLVSIKFQLDCRKWCGSG